MTTLRILAVNPGSTSTKIAVYQDGMEQYAAETRHDPSALQACGPVNDQLQLRMAAVQDLLAQCDMADRFDAIAGRGGFLRPIAGGVYEVNAHMLKDLAAARYGEHASNLGAPMALALAQQFGVKAFVADPVVTDELDDCARITGLPQIRRRSVFHALSHRGAGRAMARKLGRAYEQCNFIVAHLGGGISIGAHRKGRVVDVINAIDGEGPFSPERCGSLPACSVLQLVEEGADPMQLRRTLQRESGMQAHLGTTDMRTVLKMAETDSSAALIRDGFIHSLCRNIASMTPALYEQTAGVCIDAILVTGGMARSKWLVQELEKRLGFMAPVQMIPDGEEMRTLANEVLYALAGKAKIKHYSS